MNVQKTRSLISRHKIIRDWLTCRNQSMSLTMENSSLKDIELKDKIFSQERGDNYRQRMK